MKYLVTVQAIVSECFLIYAANEKQAIEFATENFNPTSSQEFISSGRNNQVAVAIPVRSKEQLESVIADLNSG